LSRVVTGLPSGAVVVVVVVVVVVAAGAVAAGVVVVVVVVVAGGVVSARSDPNGPLAHSMKSMPIRVRWADFWFIGGL
jgi:hypothetical protein